MIVSSFYSQEELKLIGFESIGKNVLISKFARFYNASKIEIGNNVRIDDFCVLSGQIKLGSNIHISTYCAIYGAQGVEMEDFTGLSPRCIIFSSTDDFSGKFLISPTVPAKYTNVTGGKVLIKEYSQIGAGSIIMPNVTINEGVAVGAMSFVKNDLEKWHIYVGVPVKKIKMRENECIKLAEIYLNITNNG